ncbi:CAMK family protein kinase [Trichomonas vaginalis G3]|uniref:non-specific serine/threonine protein kinase n=1 Tax=Trichomonas vaginalis (strain ATCC PRA-98 / G3) TaxID=412133 RepID=A2E7I6_TRIV3|nr:protein serine/threonine kinase protein [Trichomonas vaginalis G3]EAY11379.1 CAMK family protein kinase [Trichomonas vaginalis G3]KAI5530544.1 protein serine/threonine kinase protein [Trichomonas vaginalis G3]|eukprot:XP_001323602.1 CAMK family protein kinase [Trichomonas vaginalis G3]
MDGLQNGALSDYTFLGSLGQGSFATVFRARHNPTGKFVAVKQFPKAKLQDPDDRAAFINEINIHKIADHPLIATCYEVVENSDSYFLSMEIVENDSLLNFINIHNGLTEIVARKIFCQIVMVLDYLHNTLNVIHRDLKAENILLDLNGNIRLIDFGLSKKIHATNAMMNTICGSPAYAAPELVQGIPYTKSVDIWSIGVILFAMVAGYLPFDDDNIHAQLHRIVTREPEYPDTLSPILVDLLKRLLCKDPSLRITINELKIHPWVHQSIVHCEFDPDIFSNSYHMIDQQVVNTLKDLNIPTTNLAQDLMNGCLTRATASYKILRREVTTKKLNDIFALQPMPRKHSVLSPRRSADTLPKLDFTPTKLSESKNHTNTQSTPEHYTSKIIIPRKISNKPNPNSPLLPPSPARRRQRAMSFMKNSVNPVMPNIGQSISPLV